MIRAGWPRYPLWPRRHGSASALGVAAPQFAQHEWCGLGHTCFHLTRILPIARRAITFGPQIKALLGRGDIGRVATPGFEHWPLQGTPIREAQGPRVLSHGIHGIEVLGGLSG